jgi:threonyl-tRNA synthetase
VADDGNKHRPVLIHRAVLGSFERFIGVLIENYAGKLPLWLAPNQAVVCSITSDVNSYAEEINKKLLDHGIRSKIDIRNEKISYKIREHSNKKIPNIVILGKQEAKSKTVTIRKLGSQEKYSYPLKDYLDQIVKAAKK